MVKEGLRLAARAIPVCGGGYDLDRVFRMEGDRMTVRRIVANLAAADPARARAFYETLLDLKVVMDHGWILTLASDSSQAPQLSIASEGGSGTPVPDLSIEVDDVDRIYQRALAAKLEIVYDLTDEPWGVRRFYLRDPLGRLVNILSHSGRPSA
jgi:catechol 2,3-dioxygenase-like lactoylglutathione lyase family enzyme